MLLLFVSEMTKSCLNIYWGLSCLSCLNEKKPPFSFSVPVRIGDEYVVISLFFFVTEGLFQESKADAPQSLKGGEKLQNAQTTPNGPSQTLRCFRIHCLDASVVEENGIKDTILCQ